MPAERRDMSSRRWTEPDAEDRVLEPDCKATISRAGAELPGPARDAFVAAFHGESTTYREAGRVLGVLVGTVGPRVWTSRFALRAVLGDLFWPVDDHAA
jgi:DNA-directed RNA polymerase specialized sigma24 family protein